jgi:ribosomal protein L29
MTKQEIQDLKGKPLAELEQARKQERERLRAMKLDLAAGKVKNIDDLRGLRKDLARIETFITAARRTAK